MTPSDITALLQRQLEQHGYHLTDVELADVSAQLVMALDEHPIARLLSARLAMIEAGIEGNGGTWFYADKTPGAEQIIRQWAADHADVVRVEQREIGLVVNHRKTFDGIATVYPTNNEVLRAPASSVTTPPTGESVRP